MKYGTERKETEWAEEQAQELADDFTKQMGKVFK